MFRICDRDCDGLLSDVELKEFEREIFQREMNNDHVHRVKQVIQEYQESKGASGKRGPAVNGLTF